MLLKKICAQVLTSAQMVEKRPIWSPCWRGRDYKIRK